ncbi:nickel-dependent lactate racemase [Candidatus Formimonas warabiya]|uniref:Uncharacterized protein n=1 Tax=Formimonas warabiya TaxID=1761012 RepID=A0A3G1KMY5_FORW1|nr:nickel-dependent lactate racemase [Candidatus Formimonas warabiya]ATW23465.1 hypothetical protein DCMF_00425 [Candidatus Formimonas warabiya]
MHIEIPYGKGKIPVEIPERNLMLIATPAGKSSHVINEDEEIRKALSNPIGTDTLKNLAAKLSPEDKVVILTSDYTRPTPSERIIPYLLTEMKEGGVSSKQVTVVFASGLHRPMTKEEMDKALGGLRNEVNAISHDAYQHECVPIGISKNNTPIEINRVVFEAKLKISISTIEPHHAAGWSGGGKNVMPGISSSKSIYAHHKQMLSPGVAIAVFDGNPFREDIEDIACKAGIDFICNVILTEDKKISQAFCGHVVKAHRAGAKVCEKCLSIEVPELPDIVIATPGGAPRDNNLWQTEGKTLTRIKDIIRPGGIIILVSECSEGVGQKEFQKDIETQLSTGDLQKVIDTIAEMPFTVQTNKTARIAKLLQNQEIYFVTSETMQKVFTNPPFRMFSSLQEAFDAAVKSMGETAKVLVVPEAPGIVLKLPSLK